MIGWFMVAAILRNGSVLYCGQSSTLVHDIRPAVENTLRLKQKV